jgi:hypothetical protein
MTNRLAALLRSSVSEGQLVTALLRDADAAERLSRYIAKIVAQAVLSLDEDKRAAGGLDIVTSLLRRLEEQRPAQRIPDVQRAEPVRMLEAIRPVRPDGTYAPVELPLTPLLDTTVLTSARGERSSGSNRARGPLPDIAADDIEHQIDSDDASSVSLSKSTNSCAQKSSAF